MLHVITAHVKRLVCCHMGSSLKWWWVQSFRPFAYKLLLEKYPSLSVTERADQLSLGFALLDLIKIILSPVQQFHLESLVCVSPILYELF